MAAVPRLLQRLGRDSEGAALVEFALVSPVLIMALMGIFDLSYNIYTSSLVEGAIQQAARDSTIEGAGGNIDQRVERQVRRIVPHATITFDRRSYMDYANVNSPEDFTDLNANGRCDDGEPFEDVNGNNAWDRDRGASGQGGARDAVLYTVTATYQRQFPLHNLMPGMSPTVTTVARTVLRNQPYGQQEVTASVGNCA